jgi:hypothetical protein
MPPVFISCTKGPVAVSFLHLAFGLPMSRLPYLSTKNRI